MSEAQPGSGRVLGQIDRSDLPYENEIDSLGPPPTEQTPLLRSSSTTSTGTTPVAPAFDNSKAAQRRRRPAHSRPALLVVLYIIGCILLFLNLLLLVLSIASLRSPFVAAFIPAHFSSLFVPIWVTTLASLANVLALVAYVFPNESPKLAEVTSIISGFLCVVMLILCLAVSQLRHRESTLSFICLSLAIASSAHAFACHLTTERYEALLDPPPPATELDEEPITFWASIKRAFKALVEAVTVTLPIAILHLAVVVGFVLLTLSICMRAWDASAMYPGQQWKVDPYSRRAGGQRGFINPPGRPYFVQLACRGVEQEPIFMGATANASSTAAFDEPPVRRTILVEAPQGVPGQTAAAWVTRMLKNGELTSADVSMRVCFWDRPGYGWSESAPTAALNHINAALTQALHLSGELARLSPAASLDGSSEMPFGAYEDDEFDDVATLDSLPPAPPNRPRNGFILVSEGYGSLISSIFAAKNARLIHSMIYLDPLTPSLRYERRAHQWEHALAYPFTNFLPRLVRELGLKRIVYIFKGTSRAGRILAPEWKGVRGEPARARLQEDGEGFAENTSSAAAWEQARSRYPNRPTIVLSTDGKKTPYGAEKWTDAQQAWVKDIVGKGLERHEQDWDGTCPKDGGKCRAAVLEMVGMSY